MSPSVIALACLGGFIPAFFWLWFWLREDKNRPEPKLLIASAFFAGMGVVVITLPLQKLALDNFSGTELLFVWVVIEEILKYAAALVVVLWNKAVDEPIDAIVYMITIALGFSALENALFIFTPLAEGRVVESLLTGNFRFLGATLLHVVASGTVGAAMAFAFYRPKVERVFWSTFGLCVAIVLHMLFNFFIIDATGETILTVFLFVWMGVIALFLVFEKVKLLEKKHLR
ncbi:PrsW family intramembrane metalloprotease [Patescibacteria group bacterium]|nr:PrsW family intramembrane metalloprotease [Patescibacteria group bacterium]